MSTVLLQMPLAEIIWEHSAPKWVFIFMSVVALGVMAFSAIRYMPRNLLTPLLALLRVAFLVVLGWCLMMPLRKEAQSELVKPRFVIALDTSASMAMSPTSSIPTRWETAQEVLKMPWKQMIGAQCEIDVYPFADSLGEKKDLAKTGDLVPDGQSTRLHQALAAAMERYQGQPLAGVLLLSEGLDTRETTDEWVGMKWPAPVYTVRLEKEGIWEQEVDVAVESVETPARVIVGWASKLTAVVAGQGTKGETLHVQLFRNGELQQDLPTKIPAEGGSREVTFQLENKEMGSFTYTVSVPPLPNETTTNNNTYSVSAQVVDAKNRVLYIEDVPRWESKYLTRVLRSNPAYTPLVFLRGPDGKFLTFGTRGDTTLHFTDEQLAQFKMVILGDLDVPILTDARAQQLVKYVEGGGSLILLGGQKSWGENGWTTGPMAKMLPIKRTTVGGPPEEGTYAVKLTEEGKAHPVFQTKDGSLDELPSVLSLFSGATPTPGATVLANASGPNGNTPLIVLQRYGQGKVVVLLTDSLWRWQMEPGKDKSYVLFWNQLLAWLAPQEDKSGPFSLDLYASEDRVFLGDSMTLNARVGSTTAGAQAEVKLEVEEPGGRKIPFTMQRRTIPTTTGQPVLGYGSDFDPKVPGLYTAVAKATLDGKPVESEPYTFFVKPFTPETNPKPARADLLQAISRASQGRFCEKSEIDQVLSSLTFKAEQTERVIYNSLWNNPWLLGLLVLLLTVEWMTRRLRNMA